jgi:hypothetical protein
MMKRYFFLGITMIITGAFISLFGLLTLNSVLFAGIGLSVIILGATSFSLAWVKPYISTETKGNIIKTNNILLGFLTIEFVIMNLSLAYYNLSDLSAHIVISIIAYFITVLFYVTANPKLRTALTIVSTILLTGFLIMIGFRVIAILN